MVRDNQQFLWDLLTAYDETGRFKVDAQPSSFEAGEQFKIFHRFVDIPATTQVVFKFSTVNPVNIMSRTIRIIEGGREYLVIPDDGSYATQDALITDPITVGRVNNQVTSTTSAVTVTYGGLTGADQFTIADTDQFSNGDIVKADGNSNRVNNATSSDSNLSGTAGNQTFFLVFNHIGANDPFNGQFFLQWEERFNS
jgi:hypothetical protein